MLVIEANGILDRMRELEDQPAMDKKLFFIVIEGLIGQIERYGQQLDAALASQAVPADFHRRNLWDVLRELEQLTLEDPLLLDRIGLIRVAFASAFHHATADLAARDHRSLVSDDLAWRSLPSQEPSQLSSAWTRGPRP